MEEETQPRTPADAKIAPTGGPDPHRCYSDPIPTNAIRAGNTPEPAEPETEVSEAPAADADDETEE